MNRYDEVICKHYDVPYIKVICRICGSYFWTCPICGDRTVCPDCDLRRFQNNEKAHVGPPQFLNI